MALTYHLDLIIKSAINPQPLIVSPNMTVMMAITAMADQLVGYVLVVDAGSIVGILTERELVHLIPQTKVLDSLSMQAVMSYPVITVKSDELTNLTVALKLFQSHGVRHLPVLDREGGLLGVLEQEKLTETLSQQVISTLTDISNYRQAEQQLQTLIESTAATTGCDYFPALVSHIAKALNVSYALVTEKVDDKLNLLAFWANGSLQSTFSYPIAHTPCELALHRGKYYCESLVQQHFPDDLDLQTMGVESYFGIALQDNLGNAIGNLCILDQNPIDEPQRAENLLRVFAARAAAELERERAAQALARLNQELEQRVAERTAELQKSEQRYRALMDGASDAIALADSQGYLLAGNQAFEKLLGYTQAEISHLHMSDLHPPKELAAARQHFQTVVAQGTAPLLESIVLRKDGSQVPVDIMPSQIEIDGVVILQGVFRDITERKQMERQLADSEAKYRRLVEGGKDFFWQVNREGQFTYLSPQFQPILGWETDEWIGKSFASLLHPDDLQLVEAHRQALTMGNPSNHPEFRHRHRDGHYIWARVSAAPMLDAAGVVVGTQGVLVDVNDRKQAELALQKSQLFIEKIAQASPNILYLYDVKKQCNVYINREISTVLDYSPEEIKAMGSNVFQALIHPDDLSQVAAHHAHIAMAQDGDILELEYRMKRANGEWCWLLSRDSIFSRDSQGNVQEIIGTAQDITKRKKLEEDQALLLAILEASTDYIRLKNAEHQVIWRNSALKHLQNDQGSSTDSDHPAWAAKLLNEHGRPTARTHGSWIGETALLDASGQEIPVSHLLLAHKSPAGEVKFFSSIMRDIRDQKDYEQRLERSNAELLQATRLKDEFLAAMSHELRTPLNAILGLSETLLEEILGEVNDRQKKAIATIERSGTHLLSLINEVLEVSKIAAGKLELEITPVSVSHLCHSSLAFIKQQALKKQIQLNAMIDPGLGNLAVDERRLRQVLINLLNNAVKFTPAGGQVTLKVSISKALDDFDGKCWMQFAVIDNGIGISAENQSKLFQPFVQIESSLNRQYEGTGLGLALVKQIVELHGGVVTLTSKLGEGSCFKVCLPHVDPDDDDDDISFSDETPSSWLGMSNYSASTSITTPAAPTATIKSPLILLAEDNQDNINTLTSYLEFCGHRLIVAKNGQEAIDFTHRYCPDLILMDIQMPGVDGLEAIRTIRQNPTFTKLPIIGLTALVMDGDQQKCLTAGANEYLTKPVKLQQLKETIQHLIDLVPSNKSVRNIG